MNKIIYEIHFKNTDIVRIVNWSVCPDHYMQYIRAQADRIDYIIDRTDPDNISSYKVVDGKLQLFAREQPAFIDGKLF